MSEQVLGLQIQSDGLWESGIEPNYNWCRLVVYLLQVCCPVRNITLKAAIEIGSLSPDIPIRLLCLRPGRNFRKAADHHCYKAKEIQQKHILNT